MRRLLFDTNQERKMGFKWTGGVTGREQPWAYVHRIPTKSTYKLKGLLRKIPPVR